MPWRVEDGFTPIVYNIETPVMSVDVQHDRGRRVSVIFVNNDREEVDVAVEHIDDNNVRVSAVNFMVGKLLIF